MIELRSDTFTLPTARMRRAMADAEVGDDVYGEDPTVRRLEERAADLMGHQAALFLPSGTMANLCAVMAQAGRGSAVLAGDRSDLYHFEAGGPAVLAGVALRPVPNLPDGTLHTQALAGELTLDRTDPQFSIPALLCLETTHQMCGGVPLDPDYLLRTRDLAARHGVALHLDGARILNAAVALGVPARDVAGHADSVQFCLSKGLGAPVGSILAASHEVIDRARRVRKLLGGGMRQAGVLAAAGLVALEDVPERLQRDHDLARRFAALVGQSPDVECRDGGPRTNIVFLRVPGLADHAGFVRRCAEVGVLLLELEPGWVRAAFHGGVHPGDIVRAADAVGRAAAESRREDPAGRPLPAMA